ncbi:MAG: glycerol-3-phosphate 1-O-acyltransferase PlsY [Bacteroidales bacterium]
MDYSIIPFIILAYLLGSIPTSVWIGKYFHNIDIREYGSGNAGATNTFRVLGTKAGIIVFVIDLLKGFIAVNLIHLNTAFPGDSELFTTVQVGYGIAAILGHIFPVYAEFKGGKGVATLFGAILGISFYPTLIMAGIFFLTLFLTRYVSLSSLLAGISFPILIITVYNASALSLIIFSILIAVLIILTHQKNIERLINNEESKADLSKISLKQVKHRQED